MEIKPMKGKILVEVIENPDKVGEIFLPEQAIEKSFKGTVVAMNIEEDIGVEIGDIVLFENYAGQEVVDGDKTYGIVRPEHLIAKVVSDI